MKDNRQNIADLIGALAEDIEEIKRKLDAQGGSDKDEAVQRLTMKLEPVIRFFNGGTPENLTGIFGSEKAIAAYKKSLVGQVVASMQEYNDAIDKDMRERGIPTVRNLLNKILDLLERHVENDRPAAEKERQKRGFMSRLWASVRPGRAWQATRRLWGKVPNGWYKNPSTWAGIGCTVLFFVSFTVSCVQWNKYREESIRLRAVANKYQVSSVMIETLCPELAISVGAYEKLVDVVGIDSTLAVFNRQVKKVREEEKENQSKRQK